MSEKFTIFTPVSNSEHDISLYSNVFFPSLGVFQDNLFTISQQSFGCLNDSLFPRSKFSSGWHFQQFLKIIAAKYIDTEWYLCLDVDCFLTGYSDFFVSDKPKLNIESTHREWWAKSAYNLNLKIPNVTCGVTPMFIHTASMSKIIDRFGEQGIIDLLNKGCTEYTLYWTYCMNSHDLYHYENLSYHIYDHSLGNPNSLTSYQNLAAIKSWQQYPIGLIQSTLKYKPLLIREYLNPVLKFQ